LVIVDQPVSEAGFRIVAIQDGIVIPRIVISDVVVVERIGIVVILCRDVVVVDDGTTQKEDG